MKPLLLVFCFLALRGPLSAQYLKSPEHTFFTGYSSNGNQHSINAGWKHLHGFGKKKNFRVGYGLRYTQSWGKNAEFTTAPAKLTSGQTGLGVIFSGYVYENLDTLVFSSYSIASFNASIHLNYRITPKWEVEFNIDALGLSVGKEQNAAYTTSKSAKYENTQSAKPTLPNVLLTSDNDIGSLNSELLVKYSFKPKWSLQCGASFIFTEYTTQNALYLNNDRFRNKALMGMLGFSFSPFSN